MGCGSKNPKMSFSVFFYLDNRWFEPHSEAQRIWVNLIDRLDDQPLRLSGIQREDEDALVFYTNGIKIARVEAVENDPLWSTPIHFVLERENQEVSVNEALQIKEKLEDMMVEASPNPREIDSYPISCCLVVGANPTHLMLGNVH